MPIQFTRPESALSGSQSLTFSNLNDTVTLTLSDTTSTNFNLDLSANPTTNSNIAASSAASIPNGTYNVTYSYQDVFGNPAATATSSSVAISYSNSTPTPTPTPTATPTPTPTSDTSATPTATPISAASAGTGASSGGSGCTFLSTNNRQERDNTALYEFLLWMMICAVIVKQASWRREAYFKT